MGTELLPGSALNVAKLATGQRAAFHLDCCQDPVQTVDKHDIGKLIYPLCLDKIAPPLYRKVCQIFWIWQLKTDTALGLLSPMTTEEPRVNVQEAGKSLPVLTDPEAACSALLHTRSEIFPSKLSDGV